MSRAPCGPTTTTRPIPEDITRARSQRAGAQRAEDPQQRERRRGRAPLGDGRRLIDDDPSSRIEHAMSATPPRRSYRGRSRDARDHGVRDRRLRARAARTADLSPHLRQRRPDRSDGRQRAWRGAARPRARGRPRRRPRERCRPRCASSSPSRCPAHGSTSAARACAAGTRHSRTRPRPGVRVESGAVRRACSRARGARPRRRGGTHGRGAPRSRPTRSRTRPACATYGGGSIVEEIDDLDDGVPCDDEQDPNVARGLRDHGRSRARDESSSAAEDLDSGSDAPRGEQ